MLFAVHLGDVLEWPAVAAGFVAAGGLLAWAAAGLTERDISRLGVMTAAFFVGSQVHFPVGPGSVHLLLNGVAGVVLGRRAAVAIVVGLAMQSLLFGHGGVTALGVNAVCYAAPAALAGPFLRSLRSARVPAAVAGVCVGGLVALLTVMLSATALHFGGEPAVRGAAWVVVVANLPAVAVEAAATGFVVAYLAKARPEWVTRGG